MHHVVSYVTRVSGPQLPPVKSRHRRADRHRVWVIPALRSITRRGALAWCADLSDPAQMAQFRARIVVVLTCFWAAIVAVAMPASSGPSTGFPAPAPRVLLILVPLGFAALAAWRGARLSDLSYTAVMGTGYLATNVTIDALAGPGQIARTSVIFVIGSLTSAMFIERRRHLAMVLALMTALLGFTAWQGRGPLRALDVASALLVQATVVTTVRSLRHRALTTVQRARLGEVTDPLTGLGNRRDLERSGADRWRHIAQTGQLIAALVIDIDHFKEINDTHGHAAGDEILRLLGQLLTGT